MFAMLLIGTLLPASESAAGGNYNLRYFSASARRDLTLFPVIRPSLTHTAPGFSLQIGAAYSSTALSIEKDSISSVRTISVSPDGELMAYTMDSRIFIWNMESKKTHRLFNEHTSGIDGLAWRSSKYLASASDDKTVRIWATSSEEGEVGKSSCVLSGHSDDVKCVSFSSDGSRLASGSSDKTIRIWT